MMDQQQRTGFKAKAREELRDVVFITLYFTLFLGAFNTYRRLILKEHGVA